MEKDERTLSVSLGRDGALGEEGRWRTVYAQCELEKSLIPTGAGNSRSSDRRWSRRTLTPFTRHPIRTKLQGYICIAAVLVLSTP